MKGKIRQFFCWHKYEQMTNWATTELFWSSSDEMPYKSYQRAMFKCKKCGHVRMVKVV